VEAAARTLLDEPDFVAATAEGRAMPLERTVTEALTMVEAA
jgi:hypothetical protein